MPKPPAPDELDAIAVELYALPPAEFTAARNARAAASDRPLGARVKKLPKPAVAAWAVSLLGREGQLGDALELASALREAQDDLDAAELSRLSGQRRALVAALSKQAAALAGERGVAVGAAAREDVEKTINAAVMDAAAAAAVMTGRLVRPLEATGFESVDLTDALGGSAPDGSAAPPPPSRDDLAERRARKEAEKAAREAERAESEAERELSRIEGRLGKARERADLLHERLEDLRDEVARFERDSADAEAEVKRIDEERSEAASVARAASKKAEAAREALEERGGR
ncbi:transposase [Microbacterium sp. 4R-513]|uniref:transposase n=1 Tax=Microbacterium sp. 4R-513 TaxID=2567934 RepID=UPI0013E1A4AE|nr:transposase [Microbacterium sp. 4R-513]QIG38642.1 transposase [Microbacterium sp. 4R-513]